MLPVGINTSLELDVCQQGECDIGFGGQYGHEAFNNGPKARPRDLNEGMTEMSKTAPSIDGIIEQSQLPALPQSAVSLLRISQDPDFGPADFAAPIEADIGLTSQILRFVNSSYFGFAREIGGIRHAIALVGVRTIKNFALWNAVFSLIPDPKCGPFHLKSLWQDSLRRALFVRATAKTLRLETAEDAFAATLLQDMSLPLLAKHMPLEYEKLFNSRDGGKTRISDLEYDMFGWNHAEVGARLIGQWGLPEHFGSMIQVHTQEPEDLKRGSDNEGALVALSSLLPSCQDENWFDQDRMISSYGEVGNKNGLSLSELFHQVDAEFQDFAPLLKLPATTRSLVEFLDSENVNVK